MSQLRQNFTIPKDYAKVVAVVIAMNMQLFKTSLDINNMRKKIFNQEFMDKNFGEVHQSQLKQNIQIAGYPDTGNGRYSSKLSYSDWYKFGILQRIHLNYVQNISLASTSALAAGLVNAQYGVGIGLSYIIGRFLYSYFYKREKGIKNPGRRAGIILCQLSVAVGFGLFFVQFFKKG